jgi:penicillin-binding protein 1A
MKSILHLNVLEGTGKLAQFGDSTEWGKTGTTENNGDAWFCGGIESEVTACVWVGYADTTTPMTTLYNGGPVMGGTFPALIWSSVMSAWQEIKSERAAEAKEDKESKGDSGPSSGSTYTAPESSSEPEVETEAPEASEPAEEEPEAPEAAEPAEPAAPEPSEPAAPSSGGGVTAG